MGSKIKLLNLGIFKEKIPKYMTYAPYGIDFFFLAMPTACVSSRVRDQTHATAVAVTTPDP